MKLPQASECGEAETGSSRMAGRANVVAAKIVAVVVIAAQALLLVRMAGVYLRYRGAL